MPALDGWLVTRRDLCIEVMRDAVTFTVDDPRFSTAQVVGPSMLSLDGDEHHRHRDPFAKAFLAPEARSRFAELGRGAGAASRGGAARRRPSRDPPRPRRSAGRRRRDRSARAPRLRPGRGPRLVRRDRRGASTASRPAARSGPRRTLAMAALDRHVRATIDGGAATACSRRRRPRSTPAEVVSNAAVMMFGGIETSEGMTTTLFWHLLSSPDQLAAVRADRTLLAGRDRGIAPPGAGGRTGRSLRDRRRRAGRRVDRRGAISSSCR